MLNPESGEQVSLKGALGLPDVEDELTGIARALPEWDRFAKDGGCYLSKTSAEQLGVRAGDTVVIGGRDLVLRGVLRKRTI